jgi:hypothetical protein
VRPLDQEVAIYAGHPQAVLPHGRQVLPPGDEMHLLAGLGQASPEVPADGAGPEHRYSHGYAMWELPRIFRRAAISPT